jgi:hypothetical protein
MKILPALVLAGSVAWTTGCGIETEVQGVIVEDDLNDPELMAPLVRGHNSEVLDIWAVNTGYHYYVLSSTDDFLNDGRASSEIRWSTNQFYNRGDGGMWGQITEASWAGFYSLKNLRSVNENFGIDSSTDPLIARSWLNSGIAERALGEMFCEAVINWGYEGGALLGKDGPYDASAPVPIDSVFRRVAYYAEQAAQVAEAGVNAGVETPQGWYLFDPAVILESAELLAAQAYLYLEEWDLAEEWANKVDIAHVEYGHFNDETETNELWDITWDNDDGSVYGEIHDGQLYGVPAVAMWSDDPRVEFTKCGDWTDGFGSSITRLTDECWDYRSESNDYPQYVPDKYNDIGSDIEYFVGTEAPLILAEVALRRDGDLGAFTSYINQTRLHYGADPIDPPTSIGALEWPNAEDDAWSILDRERYLTLWLQTRRQYDLRRWSHPFLSDDPYNALIPRHANQYQGERYMWCFPIADDECARNVLLFNTEYCEVIDPPPGGGE